MSPLKAMEGYGSFVLMYEPIYTHNHSGEKFSKTGQVRLGGKKDQVMFFSGN